MSGGRLRVGTVSPKFGQHARIITPRDPLGTVRLACSGVDGVADGGRCPADDVVKSLVFFKGSR